jgi:uroporphyrinogen-III synthase
MLLKGQFVLLTRGFDQSPLEIKTLQDEGAEVLAFPTIKVVPMNDYSLFDNQIKKFKKFDYLIFTSANAVEMFNSRILEKNIELDFSSIRIAAVGEKTYDACTEYSIPADIIPSEFSARGIIEELSNYVLDGKNIFIPGSSIARTDLKEGLEKLGASVTVVPIYNIETPSYEDVKEQIEILKTRKPSIFIFTSPSTFKNLVSLLKIDNLKEYFEDSLIAVIGNTTRNEIEKLGLTVDIVPAVYTVKGIVDEVLNYFSENEETE